MSPDFAGRHVPRLQGLLMEDAGNYITKLPKAEHEAKEWQAAMEALILVCAHWYHASIEPPR